MPSRFRVRLPRATPIPGYNVVVLGIRTGTGLRWEFDGALKEDVAATMMAMAVTDGRHSFNKGRDLGIERAFGVAG